MESGRVKTIAASLLFAGAAAFLYFYLHETPPACDPRPHAAVGRVLAEEAGKLLESGGRLTVLPRDTSIFPNPATDCQMKGFLEAVKTARLTLAATNVVKMDPLRPVQVPPGDFFDLLRKQNDGDVIVSFMGPPALNADQRAKLSAKKTRVVAFCPGAIPQQTDLRSLFDQNLVQVAVISRPDPPMTPPQTDDLAVWFRSYYQVITPANVADLPVALDGRTR